MTNRAALAANVGVAEADHLLTALRQSYLLLDMLPASRSSSQAHFDAVRAKLAGLPDVRGVVLIGGYDVVPSQRLDVLPPSLRASVRAMRANGYVEHDDFLVWSDFTYGQRTGAEVGRDRRREGHREARVSAASPARRHR